MPIYERQFRGTGEQKNGSLVSIPGGMVLHHIGPVISVEVSMHADFANDFARMGRIIPEPICGLALIDTGASSSAVDESVCEKMGLPITGKIKMGHVAGWAERYCYPIKIAFPGTSIPTMSNYNVVSSVLTSEGEPPVILLLGRDILAKMRFVYNGIAGRIELAY